MFWTVVVALLVAYQAAAGRQTLSLDGEWSFSCSGTSFGQPFYCPRNSTITVPGAWEPQGFGIATDRMRAQVMTGDWAPNGSAGSVGVYSRLVSMPTCPEGHTTVLSADAGIHRHALFTVNGQMLGEHTGYLSPAEWELSASMARACSSACKVSITLDGGRPPASDPLMGSVDATPLWMWAGLNAHVQLQCRPPVHIDLGVGDTVPPRVSHPPVTYASEGNPIDIFVAVPIIGGEAVARIEIFDASQASVATGSSGRVKGNATVVATIPAVNLWSLESPALYTVVITLNPAATPATASRDTVLDKTTVRFGVRTISTSGYHFLLNGRRLFLRGYGDNAIYPLTVAPPRDRQAHVTRLGLPHSLGFNFVRHHSHVPPVEYFDAADELGMLVSPELACAYHQYYDAANVSGRRLYKISWQSYIASLRNHPSIFSWAMCNEYPDPGIAQAQDLYSTAKELDPERLVIDTDGVGCTTVALQEAGCPRPRGHLPTRPTLDFFSQQFDCWQMGAMGSVSLGHANKYHDICDNTTGVCRFKSPAPMKPVISHEAGNYNTFPRVMTLLEKFNTSGSIVKPWWLIPVRDRLELQGLLDEHEGWALASELLYTMAWKLDVEDQRRNEMLSGYEWWELHDYWMGSNGVVDTFLTVKPGIDISAFNGPSVLLQDGLLLSYSSGDHLNASISLSNFGHSHLPSSAELSWELRLDGKCIAADTPVVAASVAQGTIGLLATITVDSLPDLGTTASTALGVGGPQTLTLAVSLVGSGVSGVLASNNSWNVTLFPRWVSSATSGWTVIVPDPSLLPLCGFSNCKTAPSAAGNRSSVYLTAVLTDDLLGAARSGSAVVVLQTSENFPLPSARSTFKPAWWLGDLEDGNVGTFIYPPTTRILGEGITNGWALLSWFKMLNDAQTFLLDNFTAASSPIGDPTVLIRALDVLGNGPRSKALLIEQSIGHGVVIATGLNLMRESQCLDHACPEPEKAWTVDRLLRYGRSKLAL